MTVYKSIAHAVGTPEALAARLSAWHDDAQDARMSLQARRTWSDEHRTGRMHYQVRCGRPKPVFIQWFILRADDEKIGSNVPPSSIPTLE